MASITKYKTGYRAQVYVAGVRDSQVFRTQRDARAWATDRERELRQQQDTPAADLHTVRDMLTRYSADVSVNKKGGRSEQLRIAAFLKNFPTFADKTLSAVKTPDLAAWRDARLKGFIAPDGRMVAAVSSASVLRDINWLRNAFSVARLEWHWIEHKPFDGLKMPAEPPPRDRRISPFKEVKPLCRWLGYKTGQAPNTKYQEVALAFLVALRTAMRAGEILSLGKGTLNLNKGVASVPHKMQYLTGRLRTIPLSRQAIRLLKPVAERDKCFSISSASLDTLFRKARDGLLIEGLHFHDSRAEALTRFSRKVDVMTLAKISGHKDLSILQNTYYRETAEDIAARL
ncbi:tyrosine-type recombinase/integrase [Burkholderia cenocepacia]|uniref:tyrosine-type recombinase/integrase n=1 Tax=Burkholderia cenocepacia TaxID=95486 RepID=UPI001AA11BEB|nr:tyrosine-type recombinase/integrase [Burkholderia cenocepacia]MBO1853214.1 tyrosine-type recombinase/integrase [Burkholderia cenocepacia]MDR5647507.1 tyrosine-type recombinase/integrase [Burkholderia cenocepacia]